MTTLIAINGFNGNAGATVWWQLRGNIAAADLRAAWEQNGLDIELPADRKSTRLNSSH